MRRILLMLTVAALIVTMLVANAATALARTQEIPLDAAKGFSKAATNSPAINPTESGEFGTESDEAEIYLIGTNADLSFSVVKDEDFFAD